jgi:putative MATE family efflux protein
MASVGIIVSPLLLKMVDCPDDVYDEALQYLRIYLVGVLFTSMYNVASGVLRAVGDSRRPFIYLVITSVTNIVLDIAFVVVCGMGVEGVALATIISQLISVFLVFRTMLTTDDVNKLVIKDLRINSKMLGEVLSLGLPAAIQTCLTAFSNLFVQRYINGFGSSAMAGVGAAKKIDKYVGMVAQSIGLTTTTFISQNVGADKYDRAFRGVRVVMLLGFGTVAAIGIPIYYFAEVFLRIFTSDAEAIRYGAMMVHVMMPLYYLQTLHHLFGNVVRGFGKSSIALVTTVLGLIGCRQIFLAISMGINHTVTNVFWAYPVGWAGSAIFAVTYYMIKIRIPYNKGELITKRS